MKRLKELEAENTRHRRVVTDLTFEKLILKEAASGNFRSLRVVVPAWTVWSPNMASLNGCLPGYWPALLHAAQDFEET